MWKSKFCGAFVLNHRVLLHAIDATPARWRAPDALVDFHTGLDGKVFECSDWVSSHICTRAAAREPDSVQRNGHHRSQLLPSGIVLHYQEFGSDSAPPIVLLHDVNDDRRSWDDVAALVSKSFRVLAIDMRGHGETTRSPSGGGSSWRQCCPRCTRPRTRRKSTCVGVKL